MSTSHQNFRIRAQSSYDLLDSLGEQKNILRIYPENIFCDNALKGRCVTHDNENIFYADYTHLSKAGAVLVVDEILKGVKNRWP